MRIHNLLVDCLPNFMSCVDFCNWVKNRYQGNVAPILLIDEYDAFLKVGRKNGRFLLE